MDLQSIIESYGKIKHYEIVLCIDDPGVASQLEAWMRGLNRDCSARKIRPKRTFGLIDSVARLFAPLS